MPPKTTPSPLASRLDALCISAAEAAEIARLPLAVVEEMVSGDAPVPDVPFRWLADDADAARRVDQLRRRRTRSLRGEGMEHAGVVTPRYGAGHQGTTGRRPT